MPGIKIVLVEDDWIIAKEIMFSLQDFGFEVVGTFETGEDALKGIRQLQPHIVLLDISLLGEMSGIEVAKKLKEEKIPFVFLTALADAETINQAKLAAPYAYLVKPVKPESLYSTIEITLHNAQNRQEMIIAPPLKENLKGDESIFVKAKNRLEKLLLKDILWVEALDIYSQVITGNGKHLLNASLKTVEEKFPYSKFIRVHRSFIINLEKIDAIEEDTVIIAGNKIPVGKTYREKLMSRLSFL